MTFEEWWNSDLGRSLAGNTAGVKAMCEAAWQAATDQLKTVIQDQVRQLARQAHWREQIEAWDAVWDAIVMGDRDFVLRASDDGLTGLQIAEKFIRERCARPKWRPINTAPSSGTFVAWAGGRPFEAYRAPGGTILSGQGVVVHPTRWQPLPEPPHE